MTRTPADSVIFKYLIKPKERQVICMPVGSEIISVQMQCDAIFIWAIVNPDATEMVGRAIQVVGTGHRFRCVPRAHIGTVQQGIFVWHVFEVHESEFRSEITAEQVE